MKDALAEEPYLSRAARTVIRVPDATINPFLATLANLEDATRLGARVLLHTQVTALRREGRRIVAVGAIRQPQGERVEIHAAQVVSAAGAWVDQIGRLAGVDLPIAYSKGSLLITNARLGNRVINRLRPPSDGDIIVPGETVTITGTTSIRVSHLDHLTTSAQEVDLLVGRDEILALVKRLVAQGHEVSPNALRLRSRLGMGSCQGGFCGFRSIGLLYEEGRLQGREGTAQLIGFLEKRWAGIKPVLWGGQLAQEQLLEACYCGTLNIDGDL